LRQSQCRAPVRGAVLLQEVLDVLRDLRDRLISEPDSQALHRQWMEFTLLVEDVGADYRDSLQRWLAGVEVALRRGTISNEGSWPGKRRAARAASHSHKDAPQMSRPAATGGSVPLFRGRVRAASKNPDLRTLSELRAEIQTAQAEVQRHLLEYQRLARLSRDVGAVSDGALAMQQAIAVHGEYMDALRYYRRATEQYAQFLLSEIQPDRD
jgi:hypothetical protein